MDDDSQLPTDLTELQQDRLSQVASLHVRGLNSLEIARKMKMSRDEINKLLAMARKQRLARAKEACEEIVAEDIRKLDEIEKECWVEWDRSKRRIRELSKERSDKESDDGDREITLKSKQILKERIAEARFFELLLKCIDKREKLMGIGIEKPDDYQDIALVEVVIEDRTQLPEVMDYARFIEMKNNTVDGKVVSPPKGE